MRSKLTREFPSGASRQYTRRTVLGQAGLAAAASAAAMHGAFGLPEFLGARLALAQEEAGPPVRGGELVISDEKTAASLDPHFESIPDPAWTLLFDTLFTYRPTGDEAEPWAMAPALAESWEFADDGLSLTLNLRQGVTFHDGSPWDAETAQWNIDRLKSDLSVFRTQIAFVTAAEVADPATLVLTFEEPTASPALLQLAQVSRMVSRQAVESMGDEAFARAPVGTGPCTFVEWIPDDSLRLERNPEYWEMGEDGQPLPYFDTVRSLHAVDLARASVELRSGNTMAYQFPPARDIPVLLSDPNIVFVTTPGTYRADLARMMLNMTAPPFDNLALRQAALHALDEASFANAMGPGIMEPHYTLWWAPGVLGYDETITSPMFDQDRARELLAEAGHPDGIDVTLKIINRTNDRQAAQIVKQMWDAVGLRTEIEGLERVTYNAQLAESEYEAAIIGTSITPDPELSSSNLLSGGLANWGKYSNPEVDELIIAARQTSDNEERAELYKEVQRLVNADAALKVMARHPLGFMTSNRLHGVTSTGGSMELRFAWLSE